MPFKLSFHVEITAPDSLGAHEIFDDLISFANDATNALEAEESRITVFDPQEPPATETAPAPVYALVIDDDLGTGVSVHATPEKRLAAIAGYVRDNWAAFNDDGQDDGEAPEMTDEAAQAIFEDSMAHVGFERWYVTEDCQITL